MTTTYFSIYLFLPSLTGPGFMPSFGILSFYYIIFSLTGSDFLLLRQTRILDMVNSNLILGNRYSNIFAGERR